LKNVIFDLGAVLVEWNPAAIASSFSDDPDLQSHLINDIYIHQIWSDFDHGLISETEIQQQISEMLAIDTNQAVSLIEHTKQSLKLIPQMLEVLELCKKQQMPSYCLSNISPSFLQHLRQRYSFFELFDGIVTSGEEHIAKPDRRIFEIMLQRYDLNPRHSLFIDDSPANTETARSMNIETVTFEASEDCYLQISQWMARV